MIIHPQRQSSILVSVQGSDAGLTAEFPLSGSSELCDNSFTSSDD